MPLIIWQKFNLALCIYSKCFLLLDKHLFPYAFILDSSRRIKFSFSTLNLLSYTLNSGLFAADTASVMPFSAAEVQYQLFPIEPHSKYRELWKFQSISFMRNLLIARSLKKQLALSNPNCHLKLR